MFYFTADEHYGHWRNPEKNIIRYCNRPFGNIEEHDVEIIRRHNLVVQKDDVVVHVGDFCWANTKDQASKYIKQLNGNHIFLKGCHDHWLPNSAKYMWRKRIEGFLVVVCHYAMRTWACSHYNSWQLYAHSHGRLDSIGKQWDIGVDNNDFFPNSFEKIKSIMASRPDNFNCIIKNLRNE